MGVAGGFDRELDGSCGGGGEFQIEGLGGLRV